MDHQNPPSPLIKWATNQVGPTTSDHHHRSGDHNLRVDPASLSISKLQATTPSTHSIGLKFGHYGARIYGLGIFNERYRVHLPLGKWRRRFRQFSLMAASLLGPATRFEASKLKVFFLGEEMEKHTKIIPRIYTLTHCDLTANLTLAVSDTINIDQLSGWYNRLQRDDVVAEWKQVKDEMSLHVHCHVSGAHLLLDLAAEFRYHIFTKELPLVLKALIHGDSVLLSEHPELMEARVWVYFHSNLMKYNRKECWGPLKDAAQGRQCGGGQQDGFLCEGEETPKTWVSPRSIFQALLTFVL